MSLNFRGSKKRKLNTDKDWDDFNKRFWDSLDEDDEYYEDEEEFVEEYAEEYSGEELRP